jgi:ammonia channel protein AmtB
MRHLLSHQAIVDQINLIRLSQEDEFRGADLSIHKISANSEEGMF